MKNLKRIVAFVVSSAILASFVGCTDNTPANDNPAGQTEVTTTVAEETTAS